MSDAINEKLFEACKRIGDIASVRSALSSGADPNWDGNGNGDTAFMYACLFDHGEIVKLILGSDKVNLNIVNNQGQTCLHWACCDNVSMELVESLLGHSSDINLDIEDFRGLTVLDRAKERGLTGIVKLIEMKQREQRFHEDRRNHGFEIELVQPTAPPSTFAFLFQPPTAPYLTTPQSTATQATAPNLIVSQQTDQNRSRFENIDQNIAITNDGSSTSDETVKDGSHQLLKFMDDQIAEKEEELECPVCLEVCTSSPIFMCEEMHLICLTCRPKVSQCPQCRKEYTGPNRRHRLAEKTVEQLAKLRDQRSELNKSTNCPSLLKEV